MLCQICKAAEASIHIQEYVNGEGKTLHLCVKCARDRMMNAAGMNVPPVNEIMKALAKRAGEGKEAPVIGMFDFKSLPSKEKKDRKEDKACGGCGCHYEEYLKTGLLHCERCYDSFHDELDLGLVLPNRNAFHIGRHPSEVANSEVEHVTERISKEKEIRELRKKLREMVIREEYEAAEMLKKEILEISIGLTGERDSNTPKRGRKETQ